MLKLKPLKLQIRPDAWRLFSLRREDPAFKKISKIVLERDRYTCQFCGFQAMHYQEVVNLDQNYRNNSLANMATSCCFCAQCFFIESVGKDDSSGGVLIYLPEATQNELDGFCHVLFCAMANATNYRNDAQAIYRNLKMRAQVVEQKLGEGMSDPALLGQILTDAPIEKGANLPKELLEPLRLLPLQNRFNKQIETWAKAALDELEENR